MVLSERNKDQLEDVTKLAGEVDQLEDVIRQEKYINWRVLSDRRGRSLEVLSDRRGKSLGGILSDGRGKSLEGIIRQQR